MNWEAVGAIGEILGALAVVVTLAYLVAQLRQNTRALKSSTFQAINAEMSRTTEVIATDPDLSTLFLKAQGGLSSLSEAERIQFSMLLLMTMRRFHAVHVQMDLGAVDAAFTAGYEGSLMSALSTHGGYQEWWLGAKHAFPKNFADRIDRLSQEDGLPQPTHLGVARWESESA